MKKIITVCGPTGIGKTGFAIFLAKTFNGEIIGADSMQIYKYMDIGTAKPDASERAKARHHLVDFLDPAKDFDAAQYTQMAGQTIDTMTQNNRIPIVAGGTGLYIRSLLYGLFRSRPACQNTLARLTQTLEEKGSPYLHQQLDACDPSAARRIHPHDGFRIIRALEVFQTTGIPISQRQTQHSFAHPCYRSLTLGLYMDRHDLYERINQRVDIMMAQGLLTEVQGLVKKGYDLSLKSMQSIGYRHMGKVINHELDIETAVSLLKRDTRRYAKRQFTWFKKEPGIVWIEPSQKDRALALVKDFLTSP
ncbi:tRNA (adenosine(37)-N6)-dimethylallyltransferase MiaA [Desulfotignum phosphitoxidans]|uniref:tRNA dimethylallyltransferase n=1 Tax=Desulfotignum phosphitoxidans DSM 13687 TaxID=1286635 RepID=S0G1L5_9BACT|nr:tRNA (adenosine(37)-N6)-dimethylallyltransferase MiaA [Desulfotignum phosphitoxidans]EMS79369.1 tRNA dimethylallyltransferase MiaA [Desulfotignum phosphitoxidans DSM 13687]